MVCVCVCVCVRALSKVVIFRHTYFRTACSSSKRRGQLHLLLYHSQPTPYPIPNLEYELQVLLRLDATSAGTYCISEQEYEFTFSESSQDILYQT